MPKHANNQHWTEIIQPESNLFDLHFKKIWHYRDLLFLLVKRDFVTNYKQTILGPIWFFLQPVLITITFVLVFGKVAKLSTDGIPMAIFYLSGITLWGFFSDCFTKTATVFKDNVALLGKVYFPRMILPLSIVISALIKLALQFVLFLLVWIYYLIFDKTAIHPNWHIIFFPILILIMTCLTLGLGSLISSITVKYRDLILALTFIIQLLLYATPIIYPASSVGEKYKWIIMANPMTSIIEAFRNGFLGNGLFGIKVLLYSFIFSVLILIIGIINFNKVEKTFMDYI